MTFHKILIGIAITIIIVGLPFSLKLKDHFFGWKNIKWGLKEIIKMYSSKESFFSYKRFQTGVAFFIFTQGAMYALTNCVKTVNDFLLWCVPVLLICGYTLDKVQKEKLASES